MARPQFRAQDAEGEVGVREERVEHRAPGRSVAGPESLELRDVGVGRPEQERRLAVREERRSRMLGVQILEAVPGEVGTEPGMGRAADPERVPGTEDVVVEPGLRELRGLDRAAEPVVPLEHTDATAGFRKQRGTGEAVDAASDDDHVVDAELSVHLRARGTRRP